MYTCIKKTASGFIAGLLLFSCSHIIQEPIKPSYNELKSDRELELVDGIISTGISNLSQPNLPRLKVKKHRYPMPHELLKPEIKLTGVCEGVIIKEWRDVGPTEEDINVVDENCNRAVKAFFPFVKERGFTVKKNVRFPLYVSLLPWNYKEGESYRALNDTKWRFAGRNGFCDMDGTICAADDEPLPLMAFADRYNNWIFIMNDVQLESPVLPSFGSIWSHELFHTWSYHYKVFAQHSGTSNQKIAYDEKLAREFTEHLGYRYN